MPEPLDRKGVKSLAKSLQSSVFRADATPRYDGLSDGLVWPDEWPKDDPREWWSPRFLLAHRGRLILGEPSPFGKIWAECLKKSPGWPGFRPERCRPTEELKEMIRVGRVSLRESLKKLDEEAGV